MKSIALLASLAAVSVIVIAASCSPKTDAAGAAAGGAADSGPDGGKSGGSKSPPEGGVSGGGVDGGGANSAGEPAAPGSAAGTGGASVGPGGAAGAGGAEGVGPGAPGWTAIDLLEDDSDPKNKVIRAGNDLVSGIYFASLDDGWVTTRGMNQSFSDGGAVFKAKHTSLTKLLFSGNRDGLCQLGSIDFLGLDPSPDGVVALAHACDLIASHDGGKTFGITRNEVSDQLGIEQVLALRALPDGGTLLFADTGYVDTTASVAGPNADWTTLWAPEASPPTPNPVPADQCQHIQTNAQPSERTVAYVSPKADLIAYVTTDNADAPVVCVSKDGGSSFFPKSLPGVPADAADFAPAGVAFANAKVGVTFWANYIYPGSGYIYRTSDGGDSWQAAALPKALKTKEVSFFSAFFAPDAQHAWVVGYDYSGSAPFLLRTADAGATWVVTGGDLAAVAQAAGASIPKLYAGFALDANHIWVGGDYGLLAANDAGGD